MEYDEYVDQQRRQYARSKPIDNWRKQFKNSKSNQKLLNMVPKPESASEWALDIGAGEGYHTEDLLNMGYNAVGIELLEKRVADAHKLGRTYVMVGDAHNLPWNENTFDLVFMHEVLEHCVYPEKALLEICRVLKPGAWFVFSLPLEGHWKKAQEGRDHNFNSKDTHVWKPTAEILYRTLQFAGLPDFEMELCSLDSIQFKMNYHLGDKVVGFKPHAFVKGVK